MTSADLKPAIVDHLPDGWHGRVTTVAADLDITASALLARAVQAFLDAADRRLPNAQAPRRETSQ